MEDILGQGRAWAEANSITPIPDLTSEATSGRSGVPYTVALVVDPHYGSRLRELAERLHVWVAESPENTPATENYWASLPPESGCVIETGITKFTPSGETVEDWCVGVIASLDVHHNHYSHDPGYTVLEVYGAQPSRKIVAAFSDYGFSDFQRTTDGFVARKIPA